MLLSLHILLDTLAPAEQAPLVRSLLPGDHGRSAALRADRGCADVGCPPPPHSSVATVLLFMSLAYSNFVTPQAAIALVLGANLGKCDQSTVRRGQPRQSRKATGFPWAT